MFVKPSESSKPLIHITGKRDAVVETGKPEDGAPSRTCDIKTSARLQAKRQRRGEKQSRDDCYVYYYSPSEEEDDEEERALDSGNDDDASSEYEPLGEDDVPADSDDEE